MIIIFFFTAYYGQALIGVVTCILFVLILLLLPSAKRVIAVHLVFPNSNLFKTFEISFSYTKLIMLPIKACAEKSKINEAKTAPLGTKPRGSCDPL